MPDASFHIFDVSVRLLEEALFHPTPLYYVLDKMFGISKIDPFQQLGIYDQAKQLVKAQTTPLPFVPQMSAPTIIPPPPVIGAGGYIPLEPKEKPRAKIFG